MPASVGEICPVCLHKSTLPGGVKITKGKLRGVPSNGMMCSFQELGLSHGCVPYACENGILFLPAGTPVGEDIKKVLGLDDWVSDFEITSNRPDCLSVIGLARETAATFDRPFSVKTPEVKGVGDDINKYMSVEVKDTDLCRATPPHCQEYQDRAVSGVDARASARLRRSSDQQHR